MKILAAALLVLCSLPLAATAQTDVPPAKAKKAPNPNRKFCRSSPDTGSHFSTAVCHTAAEWAQIDAANRDNIDALSRTGPQH